MSWKVLLLTISDGAEDAWNWKNEHGDYDAFGFDAPARSIRLGVSEWVTSSELFPHDF